jgi:tetratricopeptide (TPR) repeat protein
MREKNNSILTERLRVYKTAYLGGLTHMPVKNVKLVAVAGPAVSRKQSPISPELLSQLRADIDSRRIDHGMSLLESSTDILASFDPSSENAAPFLGLLAEWSDIGFGDFELIRGLIAKYGKAHRLSLSITEYAPLRMAEGMIAMNGEMLDEAIDHFSIVLELARATSAWHILAITHYWTARCLRKKGQYENALEHLKKAVEVQSQHGHVQNEVPARVLQSSILFENGELKQALIGLGEAEALLSRSDDYVTLGNIQSTYGRILERELRFGQAIEHFERAINEFKKRDSKFLNVARTIVDMSFTRIQVARHLRHNIETYPHAQTNVQRSPARSAWVKELSNLHEIILADLNRATEIYDRTPNVRGIARVHLYRGYLYLDMGKLDFAAQEAGDAYFAAESKRDFILMASARNLQCVVENARVEEEVEGWINHAIASQDYARDAVELAMRTQDRRLLAIVYTWLGLTLSNSFFRAREKASEAMDKAAAYLEPGVRDYIWEDFQLLKRRLLENAALEPKLLQWAHGEIGQKTFRQLEEDFADLVIPRLWEEDERKVSRVAARLSVSPRKVRRVLIRLGLLDAESQGESEDSHIVDTIERPSRMRKRAKRGARSIANRRGGDHD